MTRLRLLLPALFFAVCTCAVGVRHFQLAGPGREHYLEAGKKIAMVQGVYYPPRARLLDAKRTPLAWSERYFDLVWQEPAAPPTRLVRRLTAAMKMNIEPEKAMDGKTWILRRDLTPDELLTAAPILRRHPALAIRSRLERIAVNIPEVREKLGETRDINGCLTGISGWEKEYDTILRGTPGKYEVMLDRRRRWIDTTWQLTTHAVPGLDVVLPYHLEVER